MLDTQKTLKTFAPPLRALRKKCPDLDAPEMAGLAAVGSIPELADEMAAIEACEDENEVKQALADAIQALLGTIGVKPAITFGGRIDQLG